MKCRVDKLEWACKARKCKDKTCRLAKQVTECKLARKEKLQLSKSLSRNAIRNVKQNL